MKKGILIIAVAVVGLAAALFFFSKGEKKVETISTTGIVEGIEVNLSSKVSSRISEICCIEGGKVDAGSIVARLESDDIRASVEQARAAVIRTRVDIISSEAAIKNSEANIRSTEADIKNAEADMERSKVQAEEAERQMHRSERLYKDGFISKADMDISMTSYDASRASYNGAGARLRVAASKKDAALTQTDSSNSLLAAAKARLKEAEAALKLQEARLKDTEITTPISGIVVFKGMEAGEVVSPGTTILSIVDMDNLWVRIDLEETLVGYVKMGGEVNIRIEGMPDKVFKGKMAEIGKEAEFATQRDVVRGRQDIRTFRVKIKVADMAGTLKPGMTVRVEIAK